MKTPLSAVIAIVAGLLVLLGYFIPAIFGDLGGILAQWAVMLTAFALLLGIANLFRVHWTKVSMGQPGSFYSAVLVFAMVATITVVGWETPTGKWALWIFNNIQVPVETSLMAVLAVVLAYASARMLRRKRDTFSIIFLITVIIALLGVAPLYLITKGPVLGGLRDWIAAIPAVAGGRGLLLGVSLGVIATALRIFMGVDRPYGG